ncbi:thioesterase family protein [Rhodobacteraceae bacterium M382]|nr:thioesterase family protein [Rhodobacteraceae bacterium M382]
MTKSFPEQGHDGPYAAPLIVRDQIVRPEWIDYNGHMNVGYYGIAFDQAIDKVFDHELGIGTEFIKSEGQGPYVLQSHMQFLQELLEGQKFDVQFRLIDHDHKRLHFFGEMMRQPDGVVCATQEIVAMNVDHETARSTAYPDWAQRRFSRMLSDHKAMARPRQLGASLGLRR